MIVICCCYGNHPPKNCQNLLFLSICVPPDILYTLFTFLKRFTHLISTHTRSSSLGVSAVARVTIPQNCQKLVFFGSCALPDILCTLFTYFKRFKFEFATHWYSLCLGVSVVAMVTTPPKITHSCAVRAKTL